MQLGRVFCFRPSYAAGDAGSARAFWVGAAKPGDRCFNRLDLMCFGGSLLANTFNKAVCQALNDQRAGHDITHFAMLHDDVVPEDGWLNTLLEDMATSGADLVSAVVPIKNEFGLTSTAIDDPKDGYLVERRLTMKEVGNLPDIFTAADCGYPDRALLVNTGCWVCDFTKPWRFFTKFEIRDRVVWVTQGKRYLPTEVMNEDGTFKEGFDDPTGHWSADVDPEDWNFSRQLFRMGAKVVATKRVRLAHAGNLHYANYASSDGSMWGEWDHDRAFSDKFGGEPIKPNRDKFSDEPNSVRGWLSAEEGRGLARLAKGKNVLEIGSFCGRSTIWMARTAEHVTALDTFMGDGSLTRPQDTLPEFTENLKQYGVTDKVTALRMSSKDYNLQGNIFDFVFIDGDHSLTGVRQDIVVAYHVLKPGGIIAFHDYSNQTDVGVPTAVNELLTNKAWKIVDKIGSMLVVQHVPQETTVYLEQLQNGATLSTIGSSCSGIAADSTGS